MEAVCARVTAVEVVADTGAGLVVMNELTREQLGLAAVKVCAIGGYV